MPGFTCAVPGCYNNSTKHKQFSYYQFPADKKLRKLWVLKMKRRGLKGRFSVFEPTIGHRVCSAHFVGGKKTPNNEVPTIFPQLIEKKAPAVRKPRSRLHCGLAPQPPEATKPKPACNVNESEDHTYGLRCKESDCPSLERMLKAQMKVLSDMENKFHEALKNKMDELAEKEKIILNLKQENSNLRNDLKVSKIQNAKLIAQKKYIQGTSLSKVQEVKKQLLTVESLKKRPDMLQFYTGLSNFSEFQMLFDFIKDDFPKLQPWGQTENVGGAGKSRNHLQQRHLSHENSLLIVLVRLKIGLLGQDLAYRFGVSTSTISRVWRTYLDLLSRRLSVTPISPTTDVVHQHLKDVFQHVLQQVLSQQSSHKNDTR